MVVVNPQLAVNEIAAPQQNSAFEGSGNVFSFRNFAKAERTPEISVVENDDGEPGDANLARLTTNNDGNTIIPTLVATDDQDITSSLTRKATMQQAGQLTYEDPTGPTSEHQAVVAELPLTTTPKRGRLTPKTPRAEASAVAPPVAPKPTNLQMVYNSYEELHNMVAGAANVHLEVEGELAKNPGEEI